MRSLISKKPKILGVSPGFHIVGFSPSSLITLATSLGFTREAIFTVSMGSRTYYPMFYDGILTIKPIFSIPHRELFRYWLLQFLDNLGNSAGNGSTIVGYFRKD
jgi:hypothetical protein